MCRASGTYGIWTGRPPRAYARGYKTAAANAAGNRRRPSGLVLSRGAAAVSHSPRRKPGGKNFKTNQSAGGATDQEIPFFLLDFVQNSPLAPAPPELPPPVCNEFGEAACDGDTTLVPCSAAAAVPRAVSICLSPYSRRDAV